LEIVDFIAFESPINDHEPSTIQ